MIIMITRKTSLCKSIHTGHIHGVDKCIKRARDVMFWQGIDDNINIKGMVLNCNICLESRNNNFREPLMPHPIPELPWQNVASDLFS